MSHSSAKKIKLQLPSEILQAAKTKANLEEKTLEDWLFDLILMRLQQDNRNSVHPLDWGRIDSRIDQRTASLEKQIDTLQERIDRLQQHSVHDAAEKNSVRSHLCSSAMD
jgi:TolA-binding protein